MKMSRNFVLFLVIANVFILGLIYESFNRRVAQLSSNPISVGQNVQLGIKYDDEVKANLTAIFKDIYANKLRYNEQALGTPRYQADLGLFAETKDLTASVAIDVIKYQKEMKIDQGYEGLRWTWDVGAEVNQLLSLNKGVEIVPSYSGSETSYLAYTTNLNPSRYSSYDSFFPPARSYDRRYIIIDKANSQHITVLLSFQLKNGNSNPDISYQEVCYQKKCAQIYSYSGDPLKITDEMQNLIQDNLPQGAK